MADLRETIRKFTPPSEEALLEAKVSQVVPNSFTVFIEVDSEQEGEALMAAFREDKKINNPCWFPKPSKVVVGIRTDSESDARSRVIEALRSVKAR